MRWVKEHAVLILQHLAELVDDLVAFAAQIIELCRARHNAELLRQRRHDGDECVAGLSKDPFAEFHPRVDFVAWPGDLALETTRESNHFRSPIDFSSYLGDFSDFIFASHIADEFFVR
jgi:hypothetical protein